MKHKMLKPWQRPARKRRARKVKSRILIVCEGSESEPNYFRSFRVTSVKVKVVGTGYNTQSLIIEAIRLRDLVTDDDQYDQVWCVFDKDNFSERQVSRAFSLAERENISLAYSNESFELWYYLHFTYHNAAISGSDYIQKLEEHMGVKYKKSDGSMYDLLKEKQKSAIKNAKKLADSYNPKERIYVRNPYTSVYLLVEELNKNLNS